MTSPASSTARVGRLSVLIGLVVWSLASIPVRGADSDRFESEIRDFEAADRKHPPPPDAVLFIGSSSIRLWDTLAKDFPDVAVINRGFGGSQIADSTHYADRIVVPYHPRRIVLYAGDNDIAAGKLPAKVRDDFRDFVEKVRASLTDVPISFISIKPSLARWPLVDKIREANRLVEQFTHEQKDVEYIDVFTPMLGPDQKPRPELFRKDGLHMTRSGYQLWVSMIAPRIKVAAHAVKGK